MTLHIRRGFIYLFPHNSSFLRKSPICFSTLRPKQPLTPFSEFVNQKHHFHAQASSEVAASAVTIPKHPQKSISVSTLSFLKQSGFSQTQLDKILKSWPGLLSLNVDKIVKPKIKIFQEFGFSDKEIVEIISNDPSIFHCSANNRVIPSLSVLKGLLGTTSEVAKFLKISGWYFHSDLTNKFLPNIELLKSCGIGMDKITWLMYYFPRFMLRRPEKIKKIVQRADQMGADRSSNMFVHAIRVISSMKEETLQLKIKAFRKMGFSQDDILKAFSMQPIVFTTSHEKIKKLGELLLATGKYDMSCIVYNPKSLTRSVEKRYKPRFQVLGILEDKNLIKVWPSFYSVYQMTEERFYRKFVDPYINEVGEIYGKKSTLGGKRGAKVASAVTVPKHPQKSISVSTLSFLKQSGFSQTQLDKIFKSWPGLLSLNVDKIVKPKIKIFQEFGFSDKEIVEIISNDPSIFHCSANNRVIPSLSVLKGLLGTTSEVAKFLKISSWYFRRDLTNIFLPNIELLKSCGIGMDKITWLMYYFPRFMLQRPENIRKFVQRADQMGADRSSKTFVRAISVISSMKEETLQLKIKAFRELGFSQDDIFKAFRMHPNVFATSHEKIKKVGELLLATGKYDMSCIVNNPNSLTRSVEKRYKPRFQVLGILEDKNLIKVWPSFCLVYRMTDERFYRKFVDPYINEVGEIYGKKSTLGGKRGAKVVSA